MIQHEMCWRFFLTFLLQYPITPIPADLETYPDNWIYYTNNRPPCVPAVKEDDEVEEPLLSQLIVHCAASGAQLLQIQDGTDPSLREALVGGVWTRLSQSTPSPCTPLRL